MEDLDIIRHDIQPCLAARPRTPVLGRAAERDHGLQPGREPGSGGPRKSDGRAAEPVIGLSRSSESPRPGFEDRGRAAEYNQ